MPYKILICDDTQDDRNLLTEILEDEGFEVMVVSDGQEAVDILRLGEPFPDVILMDMSMKDMSGHTAFNMIKSDEKLEHIPFIFVTGREKTHDLFEAEKAEDFIVKPYDPENLVARIKKAIQNNKS